MYTVLIETIKANGEQLVSQRTYYELFDAQTVAQIEAKSIIAAGGSLNPNWSHSFLYAVNNSEGENVSILVLNERADTQPLRELEITCPHADCGFGECSGRTMPGGKCEAHYNNEGRCQTNVGVAEGNEDDPCLVCGNCGEAFDTLSDAANHNDTEPEDESDHCFGPNWSPLFSITTRKEAF